MVSVVGSVRSGLKLGSALGGTLGRIASKKLVRAPPLALRRIASKGVVRALLGARGFFGQLLQVCRVDRCFFGLVSLHCCVRPRPPYLLPVPLCPLRSLFGGVVVLAWCAGRLGVVPPVAPSTRAVLPPSPVCRPVFPSSSPAVAVPGGGPLGLPGGGPRGHCAGGVAFPALCSGCLGAVHPAAPFARAVLPPPSPAALVHPAAASRLPPAPFAYPPPSKPRRSSRLVPACRSSPRWFARLAPPS